MMEDLSKFLAAKEKFVSEICSTTGTTVLADVTSEKLNKKRLADYHQGSDMWLACYCLRTY